MRPGLKERNEQKSKCMYVPICPSILLNSDQSIPFQFLKQPYIFYLFNVFVKCLQSSDLKGPYTFLVPRLDDLCAS